MDAKAKSWEIFCRVVDNFGDAGVALAPRAAARRRARRAVTLWIDDPAPLARLVPGVDPARRSARRGRDGAALDLPPAARGCRRRRRRSVRLWPARRLGRRDGRAPRAARLDRPRVPVGRAVGRGRAPRCLRRIRAPRSRAISCSRLHAARPAACCAKRVCSSSVTRSRATARARRAWRRSASTPPRGRAHRARVLLPDAALVDAPRRMGRGRRADARARSRGRGRRRARPLHRRRTCRTRARRSRAAR